MGTIRRTRAGSNKNFGDKIKHLGKFINNDKAVVEGEYNEGKEGFNVGD